MDCQGFFDPIPNHETIDAIVALCGLEMSKIHIVSLKGDIAATDLSHLHVSATGFLYCRSLGGVNGLVDSSSSN